jgi:probable HAF family extracellular repeat protein
MGRGQIVSHRSLVASCPPRAAADVVSRASRMPDAGWTRSEISGISSGGAAAQLSLDELKERGERARAAFYWEGLRHHALIPEWKTLRHEAQEISKNFLTDSMRHSVAATEIRRNLLIASELYEEVSRPGRRTARNSRTLVQQPACLIRQTFYIFLTTSCLRRGTVRVCGLDNPSAERHVMKSSCLGFLILIASVTFCFAQSYTMTDIGVPSGDNFAVPRGINAAAQITGAVGSNSTSAVFLYGENGFTVLGTLGGDSGIGNGINSSGQVAGYSTEADGTYRAFISEGNTLVDIGDLGGGTAVAYAINDSGAAVGSSVTSNGSNHPFLYSNGAMTDLGTLGSPEGSDWWNTANGVNNSGTVVGYSYTNQDAAPLRGFIWSNGKMTEMGTLGGTMSQAYAVNNLGQATGIGYLKNGAAHAFLSDPTGRHLKDLGALQEISDSWGFGINDSGVVVGQSYTNSGTVHAFVYDGTKMRDLNDLVPKGSGWMLVEADAVNNAGQIVADGQDNAGNEHTFLLTPK